MSENMLARKLSSDTLGFAISYIELALIECLLDMQLNKQGM